MTRIFTRIIHCGATFIPGTKHACLVCQVSAGIAIRPIRYTRHDGTKREDDDPRMEPKLHQNTIGRAVAGESVLFGLKTHRCFRELM